MGQVLTIFQTSPALRTVIPYGLNDRIGDEPKKIDTYVLVDKRFPLLAKYHPRVIEEIVIRPSMLWRQKIFKKYLVKSWISTNVLNSDLPNWFHFSGIYLKCMNKSKLKKIADHLNKTFLIFAEITEMLKKTRLEKLVSAVKWSAWLYASTLQNFARRHFFDVNGVSIVIS